MIRKKSSCLKTCIAAIGLFCLVYLRTENSSKVDVGLGREGQPNKRLGRVPQEQQNVEGDTDKRRKDEEGDTDKRRKDEDGDTDKRMKDDEEDTAVEESLAGEREHRIPDVTNRETNDLVKSEIADILNYIEEANSEQVIYNLDLFGPVTSSTLVIAVQVHDRIQYLRQLIISLSGAKDIDKTLIVFSHDVWDEDINKLVRSIDFAMVMQIFYPYSLQTHPNSFPGESSRDCPRNAKIKEAKAMNCINKDWPDLYGHYREAKFTQTKHHWWWKANKIFDKLNSTVNFKGLVLFLEEDHYVAEDFIPVLRLMDEENKKLAKPANILCMGTYLKKFNYKLNSKQLELTQWMSSKHNMGMAISGTTWNKIIQCRNHFCQYDDYNWDWSLLYVSLNCMKEKLQVLMVKGPRVFHIGECGVHHKKKDCASSLVMEKVNYIIKAAEQYLYPKSVSVVTSRARKEAGLKKGNGGWADKRDHQLCLNITSSINN